MKRKRGDLIGDDGELLEHHDEKPKRGHTPNGALPAYLLLLAIGALVIGMALHTSIERVRRRANVSVITALPTYAPTEIVALGESSQPTLPPQWTEAPTITIVPSATPENTPTPTVTPETRERVVTISALAEWQSAGINIEPGEVVEIEYVEGLWLSWPGTAMQGPDGGSFRICHDTETIQCAEPLSGYSQAGMIGRVGDDGDLFGVGYQYSFVAEHGGELQLRINDKDTYDNSGAITMRVIVKRYNE